MSFEIIKLEKKQVKHLQKLIKVYEIAYVFYPMIQPKKSYLQKILNNETNVFFVAIVDKEVVAGATLHILDDQFADRKIAYLNDLAVHWKHHRKGIGSALIERIKKFCYENGIEEITLNSFYEENESYINLFIKNDAEIIPKVSIFFHLPTNRKAKYTNK